MVDKTSLSKREAPKTDCSASMFWGGIRPNELMSIFFYPSSPCSTLTVIFPVTPGYTFTSPSYVPKAFMVSGKLIFFLSIFILCFFSNSSETSLLVIEPNNFRFHQLFTLNSTVMVSSFYKVLLLLQVPCFLFFLCLLF